MGAHSAVSHNDMTPERRRSIYALVVALAALIVPLGAVFGIVVDDSIPTAIVAIVGGFILGGTGVLARRNVNT